MNPTFKLEALSVQDISILANALAAQPYAQVKDLISRVEQQINKQVAELKEKEE